MAKPEAEAASDSKLLNAQEATQAAIKFLRSLGYRQAKPNKSSSDGERATVELELKREKASVVIDGKTREILEYSIEKTEQRGGGGGGSISFRNIRLILMIAGINVLLLVVYTLLMSPGTIPLPI